MNLTSDKEMKSLKEVLFPSLLCSGKIQKQIPVISIGIVEPEHCDVHEPHLGQGDEESQGGPLHFTTLLRQDTKQIPVILIECCEASAPQGP
jgi:hypothetical protein